MTPEEDPISIKPTVSGPRGRAWTMDYAAIYQRLGRDPASSVNTAGWLIEAAWAHPLWHSYFLSLVSLRAQPALAEPVFYLEGATHELVLSALDPGVPRMALLQRGHYSPLWPTNFAAQMKQPNDVEAELPVIDAVHRVCNGRLSPDTDFRAQWIALFGDNMMLHREGTVH